MDYFLNIPPLSDWGFSKGKPFIVSGPCSAETEEQVFQTVKEISKNNNASLIRAGVWKPRTRPNSFEGIGEDALTWLVDAGKKYNLPVTTEVANAKHVERCLEAGVDVLWLGARTTVNPFSVQEIAEALKGVDIPIMVKNPINPDLNLWIGGLERILSSGVSKIAAIHRGFSSYGHHEYRNVPMWEIPIKLKSLYPNLPLICDPSHICGKRSTLLGVAQKAMDLDFDGLLIESHINPDEAWSDAKQQITPKDLDQLIKKLQIRSASSNDKDLLNDLDKFRINIDEIDDQILDLISKRLEFSDEIGHYKKEHNLTILQIERWTEIQERILKRGYDLHISADVTQRIIDAIHKESIRRQTKIMNK